MEVDVLLPPMANPTFVPVAPATRGLDVKSVRKFYRFTALLRKVHYNNMLYTVKYINIHILFKKDENECLSSPCKNGGVCVDEQNGFRCQCTVGASGVYFTGPLCETQTSKRESAS